MPAKKSTKSTKSKSRVSAKSKNGGFKFKWWMALLIVFRQSFAYRECSATPTGAICGAGPVRITISNVNLVDGNRAVAMFGHFPNNFNPIISSKNYNELDKNDAIYQLSSIENRDCGRLSMNNPLSSKGGSNVNFYSPNELRNGISIAWWTPAGC